MTQLPVLIRADLDDEERLIALIDQIVTSDQHYWMLTRAIYQTQAHHQSLVSERAHDAHLVVEEAIEARHRWTLLNVARWAFSCGSASTNSGNGEAQGHPRSEDGEGSEP